MTYVAYPHPMSYERNVSNPLDKKIPDKNSSVELPYDETEIAYYGYLQNRLVRAKENRNRKYAEFNNKTYFEYFENNERIANTLIPPVKNEAEVPLSTGTVEGKMWTLLSHINNLNLMPEVMPFDRDNNLLLELGEAFTDVMTVTAEHDGGDDGGDKEKRIHRQLELLKQGTVFVEEKWLKKHQIKKKLKEVYKGQFKDFRGWDQKLTKVYEGCSRDVLYGLNVYLGDITAFSMNDQPYLFTVEQMHYTKAKEIYGDFENFQFVRPGVPTNSDAQGSEGTGGRTVYDQKFRISNLSDDQVEIIKYQDETKDEYQIIINNVMLMPVGFPLSAVTPMGKYSIAKQILYIKNSQFAYGGSFVATGAVYQLSQVIDRMLRLFELKTRKSITPPYVNTTNRVIPAKVLNPGNIAMGISPQALQPIGTESQGVTSSEYQIFREMQDEVEKATVSAVFQGQQAKTGATATEVIEVQRQARLTLGLIITSCTMLEVRISYLRLWNLLGKWLEPVGKYKDGTSRFRNASRLASIKGAGQGIRRVIPIDGSLPSPEAVRMLSLRDEAEKGMAVRRTYLIPRLVRESQITWRILVKPQEEETSAYHKVLFKEMIGDALSLMQLGAKPNLDGITDEFGKVYSVDKSKIFSSTDVELPQAPEEAVKVAGNRAAGNNINSAGAPTAATPAQINNR